MNKPTKNQGSKQTEIKQDSGFDPCVLADGVAVIFQELKIAFDRHDWKKTETVLTLAFGFLRTNPLYQPETQNISVTFLFNISQMFPDWALS